MPRLYLRIYTSPTPPTHSHSYLISSTPGGLTSRLTSFQVSADTTWEGLRGLVEVVNDRGMNRRTGLYMGVLDICQTCKPPSNNTGEVRDKNGLIYRFATIEGVGGEDNTLYEEGSGSSGNIACDYNSSFAKKSKSNLNVKDKTKVRKWGRPQLINLSVETEPIIDIINLLDRDVIVVPVSQIRTVVGGSEVVFCGDEIDNEDEDGEEVEIKEQYDDEMSDVDDDDEEEEERRMQEADEA